MTSDIRYARGVSRTVYSTGVGRLCPVCGWPADDCKCSGARRSASVPARIVAKLRVEKAGRGGKTVTVVDGLPDNATFLKELSQELKRACGVGGATGSGTVELQGDQRDRVREHLSKKGFIVKG
jgi:translation initiation factor 1